MVKYKFKYKFILKKHISYKNRVGYVCEGKLLGKKSHVYIRSVYRVTGV